MLESMLQRGRTGRRTPKEGAKVDAVLILGTVGVVLLTLALLVLLTLWLTPRGAGSDGRRR